MTSLLVGALLAVGCEPSRPVDSPGPGQIHPEITVAEGDAVVATVDGVAITASRVRRLSELTGRPPEDVLERLVDFELLTAEARRRGFARDRGVLHSKRQSMVQRYLEEEFEASHEVDDMGEPLLRASYTKNKHAFVYPRAVRVAHILVAAEEGTPDEAKRGQARRLARKIYADALTATSLEEFLELGLRYREESSLDIQIDNRDATIVRGGPYIRAFVDAALALEEPGDVSPPVDTKFGTHILYLKEVRDARNRSFEEASAEVATREHPFWLKAEFHRLTEELRLSTKVSGYTGVQRRDPN